MRFLLTLWERNDIIIFRSFKTSKNFITGDYPIKPNALTLLLSPSMLLTPVFTACSDATENAETTAPVQSAAVDTPADGAAAEEVPDEPQDFYGMTGLSRDLNLDGYDVKFDVEEGNNGTLTARSVWVEEDSGDIVDAAIFERNMNVMEGLNCNITLLGSDTYGSSSNTKTRLRTQVQAGSDDIQLAGFYQYYGTVIATENLVYNMANLPYNDFSRDYWGVDYMNDLSYKGAYFFATGPIALRYTGGVYVTYINSNLWGEFYPETDIYDIVRDGKWTYDLLYDLTNATYIDTNGNGNADSTDVYGYIQALQDMVDGMAVGADVKWSERDAEGNVAITVNSERSISFYEKLYKLMYNSTGAHSATQDDSVTVMKMFNDGYGMITMNKMFQAEIYLREMEDDYTIVPIPKFNAAQDRYICANYDVMTYIMPKFVSDTELFGAVLEWMSYEGSAQVTDAYIETTMKYKAARDETMAEMVQMCLDASMIDLGSMYCYNWCSYDQLYFNVIRGASLNFASYAAAQDKAIGTRLTEIADAVANVQ